MAREDSEDRPLSMGAGSLIDILEFVDNPEPRCPCVILVDTSLSMNRGKALDALDDQFRLFKKILEEDYLASLRVEVSVVSFGDGANVVRDFAIMDDFAAPTLRADGFSSRMGEGIRATLDHIENRRGKYRAGGIAHHKPVALMITDGDETGEAREGLELVKRAKREGRITFWAAGVPGADVKRLRQTLGDSLIDPDNLTFDKLLGELASYMSRVSRARDDHEMPLVAGRASSHAP